MELAQIVDILLVQNERVLLVQQKKPSAYGLWGFPGGHLEAGESPQQAILREIREELGVTLAKQSVVSSFTRQEQKTSEGPLEVTTFLAAWSHSTIAIQQEELLGYGWFTLEQMTHIASYLRSPWILPSAKKFLPGAPPQTVV